MNDMPIADPDLRRSASHSHMVSHLTGPFMAGPPDHPWGSKGLFTGAVFASLRFAAQ